MDPRAIPVARHEDVDQLEGFVDGLEGTATSIDAHVDQLEGFVDGLEGTATAIDGHVDQLEGFVDGLEGTATAIDGHVDQLEGYTDQLEGYVDGLEGAVGAPADTVAASDTASASLVSLTKRALQSLTSLIAAVGGVLTVAPRHSAADWTTLAPTTANGSDQAVRGVQSGKRQYVTGLQVVNVGTAQLMTIKSNTTSLFQVYVPANTPMHFIFPTPLRTAVGEALNVNAASGAVLYINAQGYDA